jgi:pimeloyl-ACP methyl ester carboxylesterase
MVGLVVKRPKRARSTPHEQRDVTVLGLRLRYVDIRPPHEEGLPLLLAHGHSSRIEEYDALVPHLARGRRVIIPDLPGSGYSDKPHDRAYSLPLYEDALLGVLDALDIGEAHVGGGSLGGNLALRLAHREPDRIRRVAAWAPASSWERMHGWARFSSIARHAPWLFFPSLWVQSRFWYSPKWPGREAALEAAWAYYREVYGTGFHRMYWDIGHEQAMFSLYDIAAQITQPIWLGVGDEDDGLDMFRGVKRLATLLPDVTLRIFEGARHSLANEEVDKLGPEVDAFLRRK